MTECDYVSTQFTNNFVNGAPAVAAAEVAAVVGLLTDEIERWLVMDIGPINTTRLQIFADGLNGREKFALLDSEGADAEVDGGTFLQDEQNFEQRDRIFAARKAHSDTIALTNHVKALDRRTDFAENGFFDVHSLLHDSGFAKVIHPAT